MSKFELFALILTWAVTLIGWSMCLLKSFIEWTYVRDPLDRMKDALMGKQIDTRWGKDFWFALVGTIGLIVYYFG